jgi:hypothetical protein
MYYEPKYFQPEEVFPKSIVRDHYLVNGFRSYTDLKIWRLIDSRITWTMDRIREHFGVSITVNDYLWGGMNQYRGYRPQYEILNRNKLCEDNKVEAEWSSLTSQHCFGRAIDSIPGDGVTVEEIKEDIKKNSGAERYRHITAVEDCVTWLHIDCRMWDRTTSGILFFNA